MSTLKEIEKNLIKLEKICFKNINNHPTHLWLIAQSASEAKDAYEYRIEICPAKEHLEAPVPRECAVFDTAMAEAGLSDGTETAVKGAWIKEGAIPAEKLSIEKLKLAKTSAKIIQSEFEKEKKKQTITLSEINSAFKALEKFCFKDLKKDAERNYVKTKDVDLSANTVTYSVSSHSCADTPVPEECVIFTTALNRSNRPNPINHQCPDGSNFDAKLTVRIEPDTVSRLALALELAKTIKADFQKADGEITVDQANPFKMRIPKSLIDRAKENARKRTAPKAAEKNL